MFQWPDLLDTIVMWRFRTKADLVCCCKKGIDMYKKQNPQVIPEVKSFELQGIPPRNDAESHGTF